jgi:hypothetical protein
METDKDEDMNIDVDVEVDGHRNVHGRDIVKT